MTKIKRFFRLGINKITKKDVSFLSYIVVFCIFIMFFSFSYGDIEETISSSYNLIDTVLFFKNTYTPESSFYIPVHMVFSIWNFPIWLLSRTNMNLDFYRVSLYWTKLLIIVIHILSIKTTLKILEKCNYNNLEYAKFSLITSLLLFSPIFDVAQYDCFGVYFGLLAILNSLNEEKLSYKTLTLLSISASFKLIFMIVIALIIFLKEKNILLLARDFIIVSILPLLGCLLYLFVFNNEVYEISIGFLSDFFGYTINGELSKTSIFFLILIFIYFFVFETNKNKKMISGYYIKILSWLISIIYFALLLFSGSVHPYWSYYFAYFIIINCLLNKGNSIIYEIVAEPLLFVLWSIKFNWVYFNKERITYFFNSILPQYNILKVNSVGELITNKHLNYFEPVFSAAFFALFLLVIVMTSPYNTIDSINNKETLISIDNQKRLRKYILYI